MWKEDQLDGKLIHYYQTGDTMEVQNWQNGVKEGRTTKYYPDGSIQYVTNFKGDNPVGETIAYRQDGTIKYIHRYDQSGEITHEYAYDHEGNILNNHPFPIILPDKDTLLSDQNNRFEIRFLNLDSTVTAGVDFGTLRERDNGFLELKDTLHIVEKTNDKYFMVINPDKKGPLRLTGLWYYTDSTLRKGIKGDTIESTSFFVIEKEYLVK